MVLGVIVAGFVIVFGAKSLFSVSTQISDAKYMDMVDSLKTSLIQIRSSYQEVKIMDLNAIKPITKICFADLDKTGQGLIQKIQDPVAQDTIMTGSYNILLYAGNDIYDSLLVEGIVVNQDYLCIDSKGQTISFSLEGIKNDKVLVSKLE